MKNKKTIQKILIGLVVAIALLVAYSMFAPKESTSGSSGLSSLLDSSAFGQIEETDATLANAEILKVLGNIQDIQLNDDIFTNPVFKELKDTRFTIPKPIRIGRSNPFLPIGFDGLVGGGNLEIITESNQNTIIDQNNGFFGDINQGNVDALDGIDLDLINSGGI